MCGKYQCWFSAKLKSKQSTTAKLARLRVGLRGFNVVNVREITCRKGLVSLCLDGLGQNKNQTNA